MNFAQQAGAAAVLIMLTLALQSGGMAVLIHWGRVHVERDLWRLNAVGATFLLVRFTGVMIGLHLLQTLLWAGFYRWKCLPSWESAFYFSTASYSTVGSSDIVLPLFWRSLGTIESVTGVLMCGLSASFLFAIVTRLVDHEHPRLANPRHGAPAYASGEVSNQVGSKQPETVNS